MDTSDNFTGTVTTSAGANVTRLLYGVSQNLAGVAFINGQVDAAPLSDDFAVLALLVVGHIGHEMGQWATLQSACCPLGVCRCEQLCRT